jgi:hypothetical protein
LGDYDYEDAEFQQKYNELSYCNLHDCNEYEDLGIPDENYDNQSGTSNDYGISDVIITPDSSSYACPECVPWDL